MQLKVFNLRVMGMLGVAGIGFSQSSPPTSATDPFIAAVETMKRSVAPVRCVAVQGEEAKTVYYAGSAFFTSPAGDFLTAAHVIQRLPKDERACPVLAILLPMDGWSPETHDAAITGFTFKTSSCRIDSDADLASCKLDKDMSRTNLIVPVRFEWGIPPDGTQVAVTGFPLKASKPITVRAAVATSHISSNRQKTISELLLDHGTWPGDSGAPVYLADGSVVGLVTAAGTEEAFGLTIARPASLFRELASENPKKN